MKTQEPLRWRKSSLSLANGNCVEVATDEETVHVRDSKDQEGPVLTFSKQAWREFLGDLKDHKFDLPQG